jgi:hypothetical protein
MIRDSLMLWIVSLTTVALMVTGCPSPGDGDADADGDGDGDADGDGETTTGAQPLFDQVWGDFDRNYSYFISKDVDWGRARAEYRPRFAGELSADDFVDQLLPMLGELRDWHVAVRRADGTWEGTETDVVERNHTDTPRNRYTVDSYRTLGDTVIWYAWLEHDLAYIRVDTLDTEAWSGITDADIEDIFLTFAGAAGMIVDLRPNSGGNETNASRIASRLVETEVTYGYVETRNGPGHGDFDAMVEKRLTPSSGTRFSGPVVGLIGQRCMSSAEWFTLMLRAAGARLVGDVTRGASGNPREYGPLANGVSYMISTWIAYAPDASGSVGPEVEDRGIEPDVTIAPESSFDGEHDYVVERGIAELLEMIAGGGDDECMTECLAECDEDDAFCRELCESICEDL